MQFPLQATFKLIAIAPQIALTDRAGTLLLYVRQKAFKFKEAVTIFADVEQTQPVLSIKADRVIDFSAQYTITQPDGTVLGALRRKGMRSLWKANYEITGARSGLITISELNPWVKMLDGLLSEIPIVGMLTSYFLHPTYEVNSETAGALMQFKKQPALWEGRYKIDQITSVDEATDSLAVAAIMMVLLLERSRG